MVTAVDITTPVVQIVLLSSGVGALGVLWRKVVRPLWRFIGWLRHEVRDEMKRRQQVDELIKRELTHNGGGSMKDAVMELRTGQKTTFAVFDRWIEKNQHEHDEIWVALASLGVDRRRAPADPGNGAT